MNDDPRVNASFRLPEPLYVRLMAAAERNLRTMSNEAAFRLRESFRDEDKAAAVATPPRRRPPPLKKGWPQHGAGAGG
jgi:hypothetical protein